MHLVKLDTQGESQSALINPDHVAYLAESIYGTAIHFASGEYIVCMGELEEVAARLFAATPDEDYLIVRPEPAPG